MPVIRADITKEEAFEMDIKELRSKFWIAYTDRKKAWTGYFKNLNRVRKLEKELKKANQEILRLKILVNSIEYEEIPPQELRLEKELEEAREKIAQLEKSQAPVVVQVSPPPTNTNTTQKWCEVCKANVSKKNFAAHIKTKKHTQNL